MGSLPSDCDRTDFEAQLRLVPLTRDGEAATSVSSSLSPALNLHITLYFWQLKPSEVAATSRRFWPRRCAYCAVGGRGRTRYHASLALKKSVDSDCKGLTNSSSGITLAGQLFGGRDQGYKSAQDAGYGSQFNVADTAAVLLFFLCFF